MQGMWYRLDLARDGSVVSFKEVKDPDNPKRRIELATPSFTRTSGTQPFFIDTGVYLLGIPAGDSTKEVDKAKKAHDGYVEFIDRALNDTGNRLLQALQSFLSTHLDFKKPDGFDPSRFIAIYVNGKFLAKEPQLQEWWWNELNTRSQSSSGNPLPCAVCGNETIPQETVLMPITGLSDIGGGARMHLVAGNEDVFDRRGMPGASGASLCLTCGNDSHQALNALIADPEHQRRLGKSKILWWADTECGDLLSAVYQSDEPDDAVGRLIDSIYTGELVVTPESKFYALTLGANSNRVVVRDWAEAPLLEIVENISRWMHKVDIINYEGSQVKHPSIYALLFAALRTNDSDKKADLSKLPQTVIDKTVQSALYGSELPRQLLTLCLLRIRAGQGKVTSAQAALLKACLLDNQRQETGMDVTTELDAENEDVAYRCGRLLAVMGRTSERAGHEKDYLVSRSYASASTTPRVIFTRLLRLHKAHLSQIRRENQGEAENVQKKVENIMSGIDNIPTMFNADEQARFALGMYHEQAARRAASTKAAENIESTEQSEE
jgi:CRISPR-associated protein Csd1